MRKGLFRQDWRLSRNLNFSNSNLFEKWVGFFFSFLPFSQVFLRTLPTSVFRWHFSALGWMRGRRGRRKEGREGQHGQGKQHLWQSPSWGVQAKPLPHLKTGTILTGCRPGRLLEAMFESCVGSTMNKWGFFTMTSHWRVFELRIRGSDRFQQDVIWHSETVRYPNLKLDWASISSHCTILSGEQEGRAGAVLLIWLLQCSTHTTASEAVGINDAITVDVWGGPESAVWLNCARRVESQRLLSEKVTGSSGRDEAGIGDFTTRGRKGAQTTKWRSKLWWC